jgi:hypothetical protein
MAGSPCEDFDAVADVRGLVRLGLRVPRLKSLDSLRGHSGIQAFRMDFGGYATCRR